MAESIAADVVSSAIQKLGNLLLQEALLLYGVRDQVKWVETELRRMQCFLKDADAKRGKGDERVKNWIREVIDVSYRAEDVIDTFLLRVERRRRLRGILPSIKRYALIPADLIASHKVGVEIKSIRDKIRDISESRATYGIANLGETVRDLGEDERLQALRRISPDISGDMDAIVGFHDYGEMVVSQLLDADMKHRCVISIVGMGGLGKTTLAKKVYNSHEISLNFPTRVWVTVSSDFKPQELVKSIARKAMRISRDKLENMEEAMRISRDKLENMGEDELEKELCDFLKERRYLIVMDDVWTTDVWRMINAVLPDVTNGSRVLFTTRFVDVSKCDGADTNSFMLPLLNNEESWELFSKKVFPTTCFPKELEELGRRMVERCEGLPLALVVLGSILLTKVPTPIVWMQIKESMDWGATSDGERCMQILALSYRNLPHLYLKSCFLYIASFPEDSEIYASELIRLWIAEGFIPEKEKEEMEDTARGYLDELAQRSMVQIVSNHVGVLKCRIHDLLREMAIAEAKQDKFFSIIHSRGSETTSAVNYDSNTSFDQNISSSRRLVLHNLTNNVCSRGLPLSNTRSLLLHSDLRSDCVSSILQGLKLLKVLDMHHTEDLPRADLSFPKEIKFMTHLRYLKLSNVKFSPPLKLPSSIGKLSNLQTIDLEYCVDFNTDVSLELPKELGELPNLRHLLLPITVYRIICPLFTATKKLQTLVNIYVEQQWMDESLPRLTSLRRLAIYTSETGNMLFHSLRELTRLVELSINSFNVPIETILTMVSNNDHLHKLNLSGESETLLPEINRFPRNLTELRFSHSEMEYDPMPILEKLPNLVILELSTDSYNGMEMVCTADGFPKLGMLKIHGIKKLENWIVEVGAFPKLWSIEILYCPSLTMLPDGLLHVTSLRELGVVDARKEFRDRLRKDVGEDWHKIKHVLTISVEE